MNRYNSRSVTSDSAAKKKHYRGAGTAKTRLGVRNSNVEQLEPRLLMSADPIPVTFNIPPDVVARGVWISAFGQLTASYTNSAGTQLGNGAIVYFDSSINDYAQATSSSILSYQLPGTGSILELPNTLIKGGQIVIGVGSAPDVVYNGVKIATPVPNLSPDQYFGLFEYSITSGGLDLDISEVDQVGFPFTVTTDPAGAPPAEDGIGIPLHRDVLFNDYAEYLASLGPAGADFLPTLTAGNGYRILSPKDYLEQAAASDPLNSYFNSTIDAFFSAFSATNSFNFTRDGYNFTGNTSTYTDAATGLQYPALALTASGLSGTYYILEPFFSNNGTGTQAAPSWLPHADQSPSQMVFSADGVFNSGVDPNWSINSSILSDLENSIVSAFNRGIATTVAPNNWAPALNFESVTPTGGGQLDPNTTYYYVITEVNTFGESVASNEIAVTTTSTDRSATLSWLAQNGPNQAPANPDGPTAYKVYRRESGQSSYILVYTVSNNGVNPATGYTDDNTSTHTNESPMTYYPAGSTANWYSAFLHLPSVSINGLAYGFPYDDQGGFSTNFQGFFNSVTIDLMPWGNTPLPNAQSTIRFLDQPANGIVGGTTTATFEVVNSLGTPVGGALVTVYVAGAQSGTYTVITDPTTGIGTITFLNRAAGFDRLLLLTAEAMPAMSREYQVLTGFMPPSSLPNFPVPGQEANVSALGQNALPATDVLPDQNASWGNAVAWNYAYGSISPLAGNTRLKSLEDGALGLFQPLARGGHALGPEIEPPKFEDEDATSPKVSNELDRILDMIARIMRG